MADHGQDNVGVTTSDGALVVLVTRADATRPAMLACSSWLMKLT